MKTQIIKDLVKVADSLDRKGLYKESDMVDSLIQKIAGDGLDRFGLVGEGVQKRFEGVPVEFIPSPKNKRTLRGQHIPKTKDGLSEPPVFELQRPEPSEEDIKWVYENKIEGASDIIKNHMISAFNNIIDEGEVPSELRKYYPGWKPKHFEQVLEMLDKE